MNNYWKDKHERLCIDWVNNYQDPKEQYRIYKALKPQLVFMARNILVKYYPAYNFNQREEIVNEAINDVFLKLHKFNPELKTKAYSFVGTIIRRYYISKIIDENVKVRKQSKSNTLSLDSFEFEFIDTYQPETKTDDIDYQELIISRLKEEYRKYDAMHHTNEITTKIVLKRINDSLVYLATAIDYFQEFGVFSIDMKALNEYIRSETGFRNTTIWRLSKLHFNYHTRPEQYDERMRKETLPDRLINDDLCPNYSVDNLRQRLARRMKDE